jgi:hypothetical protein
MSDTTDYDDLDGTQDDETTTPEVEAPDTEDEATQDDPGEPGDTDQPDPDRDNANREAARYRRKLRETESQRDQLAARLEVLQRAEVERQAANTLADPADVWVAGTNLTDLLGEDGNIDPDKVQTTLNELTQARPHWKRPQRRPATLNGQRSGASGSPLPATTSWATALKGE